MIGSGSILSDVDITIDNGDELVNPFNLLDVQSIKLDPSFNELFENIDLEKLYSETCDFDPTDWMDIFGVVLIKEDLREALLRFAWWMCREIIFSPSKTTRINISDLLNNSEDLLYINIYIYYSDANRFVFQLRDGAKMVVKFLNNSILV